MFGEINSALTQEELEDITSWSSFSKREVIALFDRFCELDIYSKGFITYVELMRVPEFHSNPLSSLLIREIEHRTNGDNLTFPYFLEIMSIFNFRCDKKLRIDFLFKAFDMNNNNRLCRHVLCKIGHLIGNYKFPMHVLNVYDLENKGYISHKDFVKFYINEDLEKKFAINFEDYFVEKKTLGFREFFKQMFCSDGEL